MTEQFIDRRRSGILLPINALPDGSGNGDFDGAKKFIDFLVSAGIGVWQVLPLGPTHEDCSPYLCLSAHAGNPDYIGVSWLREQRLLSKLPEQCHIDQKSFAPDHCNHSENYRKRCVVMAFDEFRRNLAHPLHCQYERFIRQHGHWLADYALFIALRSSFMNIAWYDWHGPLRDYDRSAAEKSKQQLLKQITYIQFEQFVFFTQWHEIKEYAHAQGILLFGDMPLFVAHDSADVWSKRQYFLLDGNGKPKVVAGVPPDYFSAAGQRWGNPHYDWEKISADGFGWWVERVQTNSELYDLVRIDHFRGLEAVWEIPYDAETAEVGEWRKVPGLKLLNELKKHYSFLPLVAEDLGLITPEVVQLRQQFHLPGMAVLQFAFDSDDGNPYLPPNLRENSVVYTGTHDNNTTLGWFSELPPEKRLKITKYLACNATDMPWALIEMAFNSVALLAVVPLQDVLGLGASHRLNTPGTVGNNWHWRFSWEQLTEDATERLFALNQSSERVCRFK